MSSTLNVAALRDLLRGPVCLALDTSSARGKKANSARVLNLADLVNQVNEDRAATAQIAVVIPTLVHAERLFQLAREKGAGFDPELPNQAMMAKNIRFLAFELPDAEHHATSLYERYPTDSAWKQVRLARGAEAETQGAPPERMSTTVDWFIRTQVTGRQMVVLCEDAGPEWSGAPLLARYDDAVAALRELLPS